jgi:hypothetical protein
MLTYFVTSHNKNSKTCFYDKKVAFDYVIRKIIKHDIVTSLDNTPSISIEVWDATETPEVLVPCNIKNFMKNISMTKEFLYTHPFYAHHLIVKQSVLDDYDKSVN